MCETADAADIAVFGMKLGYDYNTTVYMMEECGFIPFYEDSVKVISESYGQAYGYPPELSEIFREFVKTTGITTITG
jgi:hypothetical protein